MLTNLFNTNCMFCNITGGFTNMTEVKGLRMKKQTKKNIRKWDLVIQINIFNYNLFDKMICLPFNFV